uniref:Protein kinase domain-containing protein n=1 Tax=Stegastes partitus TaxID=144197 RepID=A0A3B5AUH4_9TELE
LCIDVISYTVLDILGEGAFAVVAKCQNTRTNRIEAIKACPTCTPLVLHTWT